METCVKTSENFAVTVYVTSTDFMPHVTQSWPMTLQEKCCVT